MFVTEYVIRLEKYQSISCSCNPVTVGYLSILYNRMFRIDWEVGNLGVYISLEEFIPLSMGM